MCVYVCIHTYVVRYKIRVTAHAGGGRLSEALWLCCCQELPLWKDQLEWMEVTVKGNKGAVCGRRTQWRGSEVEAGLWTGHVSIGLLRLLNLSWGS